MKRYRIGHDYRSNGLGPWLEGTEVELDDDVAEFVERDSPGTLRRVSGGNRATAEPPADRMSRGGADRAKPAKEKKLSKKERERLEAQEAKRAARDAGEGRGGADREGGPSDQGPITSADHKAVRDPE